MQGGLHQTLKLRLEWLSGCRSLTHSNRKRFERLIKFSLTLAIAREYLADRPRSQIYGFDLTAVQREVIALPIMVSLTR